MDSNYFANLDGGATVSRGVDGVSHDTETRGIGIGIGPVVYIDVLDSHVTSIAAEVFVCHILWSDIMPPVILKQIGPAFLGSHPVFHHLKLG